ncbi:hypothetical protein F4556_005824 [Kitasatospora gansuensis]|uniref:Uncharacterized protein n=1 Tax=Kitasatospora gansuensis TaxID=258050 RepID=A0A7W7SH37_9ACTN|nr:hypothetical protein [Kitasatospora gansuensis]MBB4950289.1 hypothetical protein [Kitasatospora gansuensis]
MHESTAQGVRYLLGLAPPGTAGRVCERLGIAPYGLAGPTRGQPESVVRVVREAPRAVRVWLLRQDDRELNRLLCREGLLPAGVAEDVRSGLLFGPRRSEPAPAGTQFTRRSRLAAPEALIGRLRRATGSGSLRDARAAAAERTTSAAASPSGLRLSHRAWTVCGEARRWSAIRQAPVVVMLLQPM